MAAFRICSCSLSCTRESQHRIELLRYAAMGNVTFGFIHSATPRECNAKLEGRAALHVAAIYDNAEMVRVLVRQGARCNARTNTQRTPLHYASCHGAVSVVRALLDCGGDCNARDRSGLTPIHLAALHKHRSVAELLGQNGADLNAKSKEKWTPLHLACQAGSVEVVEFLLANNVACDAANRRGYTALHVSAELGWSAIVRLLLCHGASPYKRSNTGWTALHLAAQEGRLEVIQTFVDLNTTGLLETGTPKGQNALHIAAMHGHERVAFVLISGGLSIYTADKASCSPLSLASSSDFRQRMWQLQQDLTRRQQPAPPPTDESGSPTSSRFKVSSKGIPGKNDESATPTDQTVANDDQGKQARELERAATNNQTGLEAQLPLRQENCAFSPSSSKVKGPSRDTSSFSSRGCDEPVSERRHQGRENGGTTSPTDQSLTNDSQKSEARGEEESEATNHDTEPETGEQTPLREEQGTVGSSFSKVKSSGSDTPSFSSSEIEASVLDQHQQEIARKVSNLKRRQIIAGKFRITGSVLPTKPLIRTGEDLLTGEEVQLKFYSSTDRFRNSDEFHLRVRTSRHICRTLYMSPPSEDLPLIVFPNENYTLADWMMGEKPVAERNKCLTDIAKGLRDMEKAKIVHCRLTPQNVVYFKDGDSWKLTNLDRSVHWKTTPTSLAVGMYSAPELMFGAIKKSIDFSFSSKLDAWSFGIIMYEVLTGENFYGSETSLPGMTDCLTPTYIQEALRRIEQVHERELMQDLLQLDETKRLSFEAVASFFEEG